jgi:hypothetical protein
MFGRNIDFSEKNSRQPGLKVRNRAVKCIMEDGCRISFCLNKGKGAICQSERTLELNNEKEKCSDPATDVM